MFAVPRTGRAEAEYIAACAICRLRMQDIPIVEGDGQKRGKAGAFSPSNHRLSRVRAPQEFAGIGSGGATVFEGHVAIAHDPAIPGGPLH